MIKLTEQQVDEALCKIQDGLPKYCWVQVNFKKCDVSRDYRFQSRFNDFYKVRRGAEWRGSYYRLMQQAKEDGITFSEALHELASRYETLMSSCSGRVICGRF